VQDLSVYHDADEWRHDPPDPWLFPLKKPANDVRSNMANIVKDEFVAIVARDCDIS
jgi:hypothetical protein